MNACPHEQRVPAFYYSQSPLRTVQGFKSFYETRSHALAISSSLTVFSYMFQEINSNTVFLLDLAFILRFIIKILLPVNTTTTFYQKTKFLPLVLNMKQLFSTIMS